MLLISIARFLLLSVITLKCDSYHPICSVDDGKTLSKTISSKLLGIFSAITNDVNLMKEFAPSSLGFDSTSRSSFVNSSSMKHSNDTVANNSPYRLLDLFYGFGGSDDRQKYYVDGRTVDTDLIAIQSISTIIPYIVERHRKSADQYFLDINSLVSDDEPSPVIDGFIITGNDIWSMYPSIPLQNFSNCDSTDALCMIPAGTYWEHHLDEYSRNGTYGDYFGAYLNSTGDAFYVLTTPAQNPFRETKWTPPYVYAYANLISCVAPVYLTGTVDGYYYNDAFFGTIGLDITLTSISNYLVGFEFTKTFLQFVIDHSGRLVIISRDIVPTMFGVSTENYFDQPIQEINSQPWNTLVSTILSHPSSSGSFALDGVHFSTSNDTLPSYVFFDRWDYQTPNWIAVFISSQEEVDYAINIACSSPVVSIDTRKPYESFSLICHHNGTILDAILKLDNFLPSGVWYDSYSQNGQVSIDSELVLAPGNNVTVTYHVSTSDAANNGLATIGMSVQGNSSTCNSGLKSSFSVLVTFSIKDTSRKPFPYMAAIGGVAGASVLLVLLSYWIGHINIARRLALKNLLIHRSMYDGVVEDLILHYLQHPDNVKSAKKKDYDKRTAFDIALRSTNYSSLLLYKLLIDSLPFNILTLEDYPDVSDHNFAWATVVQSDDPRAIEVVEVLLNEYPSQSNRLSQCLDKKNRRVIDIASPPCKSLILRGLYLYRRYEMLSVRPEHRSATCLVMLAMDHIPESNTSRKVALKFMTEHDQFTAELNSRHCGFKKDYVVDLLTAFDSTSGLKADQDFFEDAENRGFSNYPFCIVLSACEENLKRVIDEQNVVGNMEEVARMFKQIVLCVQHIHDKGVVHGDLKPTNIMRAGNRYKLIDLDASVTFKVSSEASEVWSGMQRAIEDEVSQQEQQFVGAKYSSLYVPPELIYVDSDGWAMVRTYLRDPDTGLPCHNEQYPYDLLPADPSVDIWALGVILYYLCVGSTLFQGTVEDNIFNSSDLAVLGRFDESEQFWSKKIELVKDNKARNLISLLLKRNPKSRLKPRRILNHPFITNLPLTREIVEMDVFISYRVASDFIHAEAIYNKLTEAGLKVWWDQKGLEVGEDWEEGFVEGLMASSVFLCLISKDGLFGAHNDICQLTPDSRCDNVLLEWRIALELKEMGLISKICPIFIGEETNGMYDNFLHYHHPCALPEVVVSSIESKLRVHFENSQLGMPYKSSETVNNLYKRIAKYQAAFIDGSLEESLIEIAAKVMKIVDQTHDVKKMRSFRSESKSSYDVLPVTKSRSMRSPRQAPMYQPPVADDKSISTISQSIAFPTHVEPTKGYANRFRAEAAAHGNHSRHGNRGNDLERNSNHDNKKDNDFMERVDFADINLDGDSGGSMTYSKVNTKEDLNSEFSNAFYENDGLHALSVDSGSKIRHIQNRRLGDPEPRRRSLYDSVKGYMPTTTKKGGVTSSSSPSIARFFGFRKSSSINKSMDDAVQRPSALLTQPKPKPYSPSEHSDSTPRSRPGSISAKFMGWVGDSI